MYVEKPHPYGFLQAIFADEKLNQKGLTSPKDYSGSSIDANRWIYVGGRYLNWGHSYVWTYDSFHYYPEEDKLSVNVSVKPDINIHFIILSPQEGKEATLTDIRFRGEELEDGTAFISHFDPELNIISATFGNGKRLTNGRFDIHYTTQQQ